MRVNAKVFLGGFCPLAADGIAGNHDHDVLLAAVGHALDKPHADVGLARAGAVGKQEPVASFFEHLAFRLDDILPLFGQ